MLEEIEKGQRDHAIDALRYALEPVMLLGGTRRYREPKFTEEQAMGLIYS